MAKNYNLRSPSARKNLDARHEYYPYTIQPGLTLLFRRAESGGETWKVRARINKKYEHHPLGAVTKKFDFTQAKAAAEEWYESRTTSSDAVVAVDMTVTDLVKAYIKEHAPIKINPEWEGEQTKRAKQVVYSQAIGDINLADLRPVHITNLQAHLRQTMKGASVNRATAVLRASLNWAYANEFISGEPHKAVKRAKTRDKIKRRKFTIEQCIAFVEGAPETLKPILTCLFYTACRPVGARRLLVRDVDLVAGVVTFTSLKGDTADDTPIRYNTHISGDSLEFFKALTLDENGKTRRGDEYLFITPTGKPWSSRNFAKALDNYRKASNLDPDWEGYSLRHSIITYQVNNRMPAALAAEEFGTSILYIQDNYYEPDKDLALKFASALSI